MLKSRHILTVLSALVLAGFVWGIIYLFHLRFDTGDIYPPYSSLRTDPLGAKMLYESLQRVPGLSVSRFFQSASKLEGGKQRVLLIAGASSASLEWTSPADYHALQTFLHEGGRVVIALLPRAGGVNPTEKNKSMRPSATNSDDKIIEPVSLLATNGLTLRSENLLVDNTGTTHSELAEAAEEWPGLPPLISWHSADYFGGVTGPWRTVYRRREHPVIIERSFGAGSLVLASDSYFVSNEALRKERHSELLVWLLGARHEILFDETHFGVEEQVGVAALLRRYHLEGAIGGLLLLAALFVWKNSAPLVPGPAEGAAPGRGAEVEGLETSAGFASLLRRSLPVKDIFLTSFEEWKAACARDPRVAARLPQIEKIVDEEKARPPGSRRPVQTYQAIHRILTQHHP